MLMNNEAAAHILQHLVDRDADCRDGNKELSAAEQNAIVYAVRVLLTTASRPNAELHSAPRDGRKGVS